MKRTVIVIVIVLFIQNIMAQQDEVKCQCCSEPYGFFDFWIGDWTVYDVKGNVVGNNIIEKQYDNCVLQEKWTSTGKNRGTSYNYYNISDKTWNQLWVDNAGFSLELKGHYEEGKMILKSEIIESEKGKYYNQITWHKNADGSVTQVWDILNEKDEKIQEAFKGIYKKSVKSSEN